jgi:hypothetical protein
MNVQSHQAYHRERHADVVRAARHRPLAKAIAESRREDRLGFLARFRRRRLRALPADC